MGLLLCLTINLFVVYVFNDVGSSSDYITSNDRGLLYRVSTKELYTFKIIQKTNAAYLELHTYTSR
jgi:hypothetical protein